MKLTQEEYSVIVAKCEEKHQNTIGKYLNENLKDIQSEDGSIPLKDISKLIIALNQATLSGVTDFTADLLYNLGLIEISD